MACRIFFPIYFISLTRLMAICLCGGAGNLGNNSVQTRFMPSEELPPNLGKLHSSGHCDSLETFSRVHAVHQSTVCCERPCQLQHLQFRKFLHAEIGDSFVLMDLIQPFSAIYGRTTYGSELLYSWSSVSSIQVGLMQ